MKSHVVIFLALGIFLCSWTGLLARFKGYNAACWLLGGGVIGILVLAGLPTVAPFDRKTRRRGNLVGLLLSSLSVFSGWLLRGFL